MLWLKSCPRCKTGDMFLDSDQYGKFRQCIQCSHIQDMVHRSELDAAARKTMPAIGTSVASMMMGLPEAS